jgi:hypothetical protein
MDREAAWGAVHEALPARWHVGPLSSLMVAVALAACSAIAPIYDGWQVGGLDTCPEPNFDAFKGERQPSTWDCDASLALWLKAASEGVDRRDPGHAPVVRATLHYNASNVTRLSNWFEVAVFELADGTVRAIGVGHFGVDYAHISTHDYGP